MLALNIIIITSIYLIVIFIIYSTNSSFSLFIKKYIISDLPLFSVSDDTTFHTVKSKEAKNLRYSVIYLPIGFYKIYIFTVRNYNFKILHILFYDNIFNDFKDKKIKNLSDDANSKYFSVKEKKELVHSHMEIFKDCIELSKNRKNTAKLKAGFYFTILGAVIYGILSLLINPINVISFFKDVSFFQEIIICYFVVLIANFILIILYFHSVEKYERITYKDVENKSDESSYFIYLYQNMIYDDLYASRQVNLIEFIDFIELYFKRSLLVFFVLSLTIFIGSI